MQSENFDNKIKDSLSQRPPGNETPEWDKMQTLLDQHLPVEKKDRRRIVFILFLFLLLGGGAFLIWNNNGTGDDDITDAKPNTENSTPGNEAGAIVSPTENNSAKAETILKENPQGSSAETAPSKKPDESSIEQEPNTTKKSDKTVLPKFEESPLTTKAKNSQPGNQTTEKANSTTQPITPVDKNIIQENVPAVVEKQKADETQKNPETQKPEQLTKPAAEKITEEQKPSRPAESQPILTANSKADKQKNKNAFFDNLFFTVSAGPDFSTVGFDGAGKFRPVIGAGVGYQVSEKFTLRTGFYSARKVYTADPDDYHPPYNVWTAYPNIKNIDANCKVYEIPVTVDYMISQTKNHGWFVSAGLSSFLMKEETYDYHFKPNTSPTYITVTRRINNENKHYFSVLGLSGGYTREINKNFSLRAEPYAKFALGGVGYGKVKLNGGGVLFSAVIKPFARK